MLLYEMLIGQSPFSGCDEDELFWSICNEVPWIPAYLSKEATNIVKAVSRSFVLLFLPFNFPIQFNLISVVGEGFKYTTRIVTQSAGGHCGSPVLPQYKLGQAGAEGTGTAVQTGCGELFVDFLLKMWK